MKKLIMIAMTMILALGLFAPGLAENAGVGSNTLLGGWQAPKDGTPTDATRDLLDRAFNGIEGNAIEPIAVLGTQVVSGMNTCILCRINPAVPEAVSYYAMIYIYEDIEGKTLLNMIVELDPGAMYTDINDADIYSDDGGSLYGEENG